MAMPPPYPAAYSLRGGFEIECYASWDNPAHDQQFETWVKESSARIGLAARPAVIANSEVDEKLMRRSFGKDYDRLVSIKRKYDPQSLFGATTVINI